MLIFYSLGHRSLCDINLKVRIIISELICYLLDHFIQVL